MMHAETKWPCATVQITDGPEKEAQASEWDQRAAAAFDTLTAHLTAKKKRVAKPTSRLTFNEQEPR